VITEDFRSQRSSRKEKNDDEIKSVCKGTSTILHLLLLNLLPLLYPAVSHRQRASKYVYEKKHSKMYKNYAQPVSCFTFPRPSIVTGMEQRN